MTHKLDVLYACVDEYMFSKWLSQAKWSIIENCCENSLIFKNKIY